MGGRMCDLPTSNTGGGSLIKYRFLCPWKLMSDRMAKET